MSKAKREADCACPICTSLDTEDYWPVVWECPEHSVRCCRHCHVLYIWPQITEAMENGIYANYAGSVAKRRNTEAISVAQTYRETLSKSAHRIERARNYVQSDSRVLEVGAGSGNFIGQMVESGMLKAENASAIEASSERRAFLQEQFGINCVDSLASLPDRKNSFDLIGMFHVLEHIRKPIPYLQELAGCLKDGALLLIEVPSSSDPLLSIFPNDAFRNFIFQPMHHYVYCSNSLDYVCRSAGLKIVQFCYHQRYSLGNHLSWLQLGTSESENYFQGVIGEADSSYRNQLEAQEKTDTVICFARNL